MTNGKKIALGVGVIGLIISFFLWRLPNTNESKLEEFTGFQNFTLGLGIWFTVLLVLGVFVYFLYSYFNDFKVHPEFKKEAKTIGIYFFGSLIVGFILALIFGGGDPIVQGNGNVYDNKTMLISIGTIIWTSIVMILVAFVYSILPLISKK